MIPLLDLKTQYQSMRSEISTAIQEVLDSQQFILGPKVKRLEEEIADFCEVPYAIGVASGSDALLLSLMALGIGPGDEVITTPYTFFATAGSISRLGARPVFTDVDSKTFNINPELIENKISPRTKAILPVHLFGQCADMDPVLEIARRRKLAVIEDAAQAIGATYKWKKAGSMGNVGCLSFFPSKNLGGYGDGGMVLTRNENIAKKVTLLRTHGASPKYHHAVIGCNSRLDALQAAVLLVKLNHLNDWIEARRRRAEIYQIRLSDADIALPYAEPFNQHVYNQYVIRTSRRDELRHFLSTHHVETEIYYPIPLHLQECYKNLGYREGDFPESEQAARTSLTLPVFPELSHIQQDSIIRIIRQFLNTDLVHSQEATPP